MIPTSELTEAELEQLFTRDPGNFMRVLVLNVRAADEAEVMQMAERQSKIFEKWLGLYSSSYREVIAKSVETRYQNRYAGAISTAQARGELQGRIAALSDLPLKKTTFSKTVDLEAVTRILKELKAQEPTGVMRDAEGTSLQIHPRTAA